MTSSQFGYPLLEDWNSLFQKYSWKNRFFSNASLHLILGQLDNIRQMKIYRSSGSYLDTRVHVCYLSPSGSGKGPGAELVSRVCRRVGLKYQVADEMTNAALLGSFKKDNEGKLELQPGWLHPTYGLNILAATEGTMILKERPTQYDQNVMNILQKAMNPMDSSDGTIVKKTAWGTPIEIRPSTSLFLTTYIPTNLTSLVIERGFLQRMYLIVRTLTHEQRQEASRIKYERQKKPPNTIPFEKDIVKRLHKIDRHYHGVTSLRFESGAIDILKESSDDFYSQIRYVTPFLRDKLGEFITRFEDLQSKLAFHYAVMSLNKRVTVEDCHHAKVESQYVFEDLVSFLERTIVVPKEFTERWQQMVHRTLTTLDTLLKERKYRKSKGWVSEEDLINNIMRFYSLTKLTAREYLKQMAGADYIVIKGSKKTHRRYVRKA